jgi:hypothetical protein
LVLCAQAVFAASCGVDVGVTQEVVVDEPLGSAAVTNVEVSMGAGTLTITPGAVGLASGTIRYNVESWKPTVTRGESSLVVKQGSQKGVSGLGTDVVNHWELELGKAPMRLKVSAGAYKGFYDLSGLTLQELVIHDGAARSQVMFNSPNPGQMTKLEYETGASTVELIGLANANFKSMGFKGGAGSYSMDFSGQLRTSANVKIDSGAGSMRIAVPAGTAARITVDGSLNDVNMEGTWTVTGKTYSTEAAKDTQAKTLDITLKMNVGQVTLVLK